jgi:hypothetical protein
MYFVVEVELTLQSNSLNNHFELNIGGTIIAFNHWHDNSESIMMIIKDQDPFWQL